MTRVAYALKSIQTFKLGVTAKPMNILDWSYIHNRITCLFPSWQWNICRLSRNIYNVKNNNIILETFLYSLCMLHKSDMWPLKRYLLHPWWIGKYAAPVISSYIRWQADCHYKGIVWSYIINTFGHVLHMLPRQLET